jgi:hypothetical protein
MAEAESLFDVAVFLVASARDAVEAPPAYGALRMLDAVARLAPLADDAFLAELATRIATSRSLLMADRDAYVAALDELLEAVATETRRRNVGR